MFNRWELRKFVAPEFLFGVGAIDMSGQYAKNLGAQKVLLVTDPGVKQPAGCKRVTDSLNRLSIPYVIFPESPRIPKCRKCAPDRGSMRPPAAI
jgi:alcohol dehydrogenase